MTKISFDKLEKIIKENSDYLNKTIYTNNYEQIYNFIKNFIFDNLFIFIIFYLLILPYLFRKEGKIKKFNYWMILGIIGLVIFTYLIKFLMRNFKVFKTIRVNECMNKSNHIIFNKIIKPIETFKELLDKPFHEFYINTSHNSYIPCIQNGDVASSEAIKRTLGMGARVIELDCFAKKNTGTSKDDLEPVVAHGVERKSGDIFTTSYTTFEKCIDIIATFGTLNSDPLIINLELNTNYLLETQKRMKQIIINKLGDKLLSKEYKISTNKENRKLFMDEPMKNLLNKIIIISGGGYTDELKDIIDYTFYTDKLKNTDNIDQEAIQKENKSGIIQRIYPAGNIAGHLSKNFDPIIFWKNKCQMVALNFQVVDDNLMKNIAMFKNSSFIHFSEFI
jgi:hypothetical protein